MDNEFMLPNGIRTIVKSISFFDSGNIESVVLSQNSKFFVTLPNTKMIKPLALGFDENGKINWVKLNKDEIVILTLPNSDKKKIRVTELGFNTDGKFTYLKLPYGDKIDIELPNNIYAKVIEITYYNTGEIKDVTLLSGENISIDEKKVKIRRISFYITGKIKKLYFVFGESITLYNNILYPKEIEYYENGDIKSFLLGDGHYFSVVIPKTKEEIKIFSALFYFSMDLHEVKLLPGENVTLPDGRKVEVSSISFDEYGNIIETKMYTGETKNFNTQKEYNNEITFYDKTENIIDYNHGNLYLDDENKEMYQ